MLKTDALALVNRPVEAWTAANGVYVGTLLEVLPSRPWRAKVLVTGVIEVAQHYERGGVCRRGFRPGETLEVGHSSIKPSQASGEDYLSVLRRTQERHRVAFKRDAASPHAWVHKAFADALETVIAAETRRLGGEPWKLTP
jgi:hypothetical protein